jgi:hypothetical protein
MKGSFIWLFLLGTLSAEAKDAERKSFQGIDGEQVWSVDLIWTPEDGGKGSDSSAPKVLPLSSPLVIKSLKGDIQILRPLSKERALTESDTLQVWDRITLGDKSTLVLEWRGTTVCEASSGSQLQMMEKVGGQPVLRLYKGRLRIVNKSDDDMLVETLNAMVSVPTGKTDLIISAMNTLIAPREGKKVKVKTKKVSKTVAPGLYGLVMPDGALLYTGGKRK